jgi:hypothetical protein
MNETDPAPSLWPTYALRAWLSAVHGQTQQARSQIEAYVDYHENEIKRLRGQMERATKVLDSLEDSIKLVDDALRSVRDSEVEDAGARARSSDRKSSAAARPATSTRAAKSSTRAAKSSTRGAQRRARRPPSSTEREPPGQSEPSGEEGRSDA